MSLGLVKRKVSFDDFAEMCALSKEADDFVKLLFAQFESFLDCFYRYYLMDLNGCQAFSSFILLLFCDAHCFL